MSKAMGSYLAQKNWMAISYAIEQLQNLTQFVTKLITAPQHGKQQFNSFGPKCDRPGFDMFYLQKYFHNFCWFSWHHNSKFLKRLVMTMAILPLSHYKCPLLRSLQILRPQPLSLCPSLCLSQVGHQVLVSTQQQYYLGCNINKIITISYTTNIPQC